VLLLLLTLAVDFTKVPRIRAVATRRATEPLMTHAVKDLLTCGAEPDTTDIMSQQEHELQQEHIS
jgi:hypothetical protein